MKLQSLIFILLLSAINSQKFYNATEFIELIRKEKIENEDILLNGINNTLEFLKHYIFYTVASDPPQPDFDKTYFPKKNFSKIFNSIKTDNTNYFDFKNEFISAVYELNDLHTKRYFGIFPVDYFGYICPLNLSIRYNNETDKAKTYGSFIRNKGPYYLFKNNEHVSNVIEKNLNTSIETINGKNPFSFIQEFAGIKIRNKHSTYVFNQLTYVYNNFYIPTTKKDLTNFM